MQTAARRPLRDKRQRAIALIAMLWIIALLTILATAAIMASTRESRAFRHLQQAVSCC